MRTIIAGGRDRRLTEADYQRLDKLWISEVVSGCARGIDKDGETYALHRRVPVARFPAQWLIYGRRAGHIRNREMAFYADAVALFPGGKGTASMYREAKALGLVIYDYREAER